MEVWSVFCTSVCYGELSMDEDEARRQRIERRRREKIPPADLDPAAAAPTCAPSPKPGIWRRVMLKGKQIRDKYMAEKRSRALTVVHVAPAQVAPVAPSAVAPYSASET